MDIMLDIETLGNGSNAVIIAIGAVKFIPERGVINDRFYSRVDPQSCMDVGMQCDGSTILWWLQQSDEARSQFKGKLPGIKECLTGFAAWVQRQLNESVRVWGNGATFDNVIVANAYKALKMERPWKYNEDRCYRTVKALFPSVQPVKSAGSVVHRADHDAEYQALHLMKIWPNLCK